MSSQFSKPRILAITDDHFILRNIRLWMPLLNLKRQGLIGDFFITNSLLMDIPDDYCFDVIWLQRSNNAKLINFLAEKISSHYLYDLDDLLLGKAAYRKEDKINPETILAGIRQCHTLTLTSTRQQNILQKYLPFSIEEKTIICPNGFEFAHQTRIPAPPQGIILTSSDYLPLTTSYEPIMEAIIRFSQKNNLSIYYFGRDINEISLRFPNAIKLGLISYWHYQVTLAALPPMIGIAPLETIADPATLDFINSKSDVKMVEFGGMGHPSVYSKAPPYVDTDLQAGVIVENTTSAWLDGLERVYHDLWQRSPIDQRQIIELRNMSKIAKENWYQAVSRVRLPHPMTVQEIRPPLSKFGLLVQELRYIAYTQDYLFLKEDPGTDPSLAF